MIVVNGVRLIRGVHSGEAIGASFGRDIGAIPEVEGGAPGGDGRGASRGPPGRPEKWLVAELPK